MNLYIGGLVAKKFGLLREAAPAVDTIGLLVNPGTPSSTLDSADCQIAFGVATPRSKLGRLINRDRSYSPTDVRFAPTSGGKADVPGGPSRAIT
jgi:hypothetical protein